MSFHSVLFRESDQPATVASHEAPTFFRDLNLDQIVEEVTADWKEYDLAEFFYVPLRDLESIAYRQEVMLDLEGKTLREALQRFSKQMQEMRKCLVKTKELSHYKYALERWFLCAVETYIDAIGHLAKALGSDELQSRALAALRVHLNVYMASDAFRRLSSEMTKLIVDLSSIRYCVLLRNGGVTVSRYDDETDYSSVVDDTFEKFRQTDTSGRRTAQRSSQGMDHIQAQVLDGLALLYPDIFQELSEFHSMHQDYLDEGVARFDREVQFYVAYLTYIEKLKRIGLCFCLPRLSRASKEVYCHNGFDLALAHRLIDRRASVVPNDFYLSGVERILVVSGPNQGGKTTFARMFGQMHYLASLGCPVPGTDVRLFAFDRLFTHFERHEDMKTFRGKLQDDLVRVRQILDGATPNSLIVMNEMFSSTTVEDAAYLSKKVMVRLSELDVLCVWVTFLDELTSFNEKTVSMVSTVDATNPAIRTYKMQRKPADGLAYALAIALKYRVTYECLKERIKA